jgi:peroxiredoxin
MTTPILLRMAIDTPYALAFTAVDGRTVDTAKMKGKVVAIDFWGTEYPECITNVLHLQKLYNKLHTNGLEVIGVNVDQNSDTLKTFVSDHGIEWPQSWDADVILKKIVPALVTRAGTILLVDKKGMLHDIYGDEDLDRKIEALLKE